MDVGEQCTLSGAAFIGSVLAQIIDLVSACIACCSLGFDQDRNLSVALQCFLQLRTLRDCGSAFGAVYCQAFCWNLGLNSSSCYYIGFSTFICSMFPGFTVTTRSTFRLLQVSEESGSPLAPELVVNILWIYVCPLP